jgi:hypothetical protein
LAHQQRDVHDPILYVLRRQVGLRQEIAARMVMVGYLGRHGAQFRQAQLLAGPEAGHADQLGFGKQRRRHAQAVDQDAGAVVDCRSRRIGLCDPDLRRRRLQRWRRGNQLELAARTGLGDGIRTLAECQQGDGD